MAKWLTKTEILMERDAPEALGAATAVEEAVTESGVMGRLRSHGRVVRLAYETVLVEDDDPNTGSL